MNFAQPVIAGGYCPDGQTDLTYSAKTFGCKAFKNAPDGEWLVTLEDTRLVLGTNCTAVASCANLPSAAQGVSVTTQTISANTFVMKARFTANDAAADAAIGFMVVALPLGVY